jgi:uncharacterized membrane protein
MMIRMVALAIVRTARLVSTFVVAHWPLRSSRAARRNHGLDALRRRYVFGALSRDGFEAARKRLSRRRGSKRAA